MRGVEALGSVWTFLDPVPYGRQEDCKTRRQVSRRQSRTGGGEY
jgi:predicted dithiol-disulfide oxidoreductase (DUF899 family)